MRYRPNWGLLTLGAVVVLALFTYPTWRTFLILRSSGLDFSDANPGQQAALAEIRRTQGPSAAATAFRMLPTIIPAPTGDFATPNGNTFQPVKGGDFIELNAVRTAKGRATIYRSSANNALILRFDDFAVTNGPGLAVFLSINSNPKTPGEVKAEPYFRVSSLKGTKGSQSYDLPPELRLERYKSVVIFSEDFNLIYSLASLN